MADDTANATFSFQVDAATDTQNQISVSINGMNGDGLELSTADVSDLKVTDTVADDGSGDVNARLGIDKLDGAIQLVNDQRSALDVVSDRLNHTVNNLTKISPNLSTAKGGIKDADFALETTNLAKNQILQQASTALLA